jgi:hypothetical protein
MRGMGGTQATSVASARRVDRGLGVIEEVELFGEATRLFGVRHRPERAGQRDLGVVVCSPILTDFGANYQREVRLARQLASAGVPVQRFHPRGSGHSDGERVELTLETLVEDARSAVARLRDQCSVDRVALLGTRFSALAVAIVAQELDGAPVVLWEPTTRPRTYFREGLRAHAVHQVRVRETGGVKDAEAEIERRGFVDLLGIPVGRDLLATAASHGLVEEMGRTPRSVLLVQLERREGLRPEYQEIVDRWAPLGFDVTAACCPSDETWWFIPDRLAPLGTVLDTTAEWVLARAGPA